MRYPFSLLVGLMTVLPASAQRPELIVQTGHAGEVHAVAFHPEGKILASASHDMSVKLWDAVTGMELRALTGHRKGVLAVAFHPQGKTLASGSADGVIKLWETTTGKETRTLEGHSGEIKSLSF